jgi:hypothetical protein
VTTDHEISELERRYAVEMIDQALAEVEESEDVSQGAIDGLYDVLRILGVKHVEVTSKRSSRDADAVSDYGSDDED